MCVSALVWVRATIYEDCAKLILFHFDNEIVSLAMIVVVLVAISSSSREFSNTHHTKTFNIKAITKRYITHDLYNPYPINEINNRG